MRCVLIYFFCLISGALPAQNSNRIYHSFEVENLQTLKINVNDGVYKIFPHNEKIIETTFIPNGQTEHKRSHTVDLTPSKVKTKIEENDSQIWMNTEGIAVKVKKAPFQIQYFYKGRHLISEADGYNKNDSLEVLDFKIKDEEILYGGGARALGMNRRGHRLKLYNRAHYGYETHSELMNYTMPLVVSSEKYMIHFDNAPIGFLDLDSQRENQLKYETISGRKTYQIIAADSWFDLVDQYTYLTGKQPMPPRWALGNFSSRFGYHSQKEVEQTIQKFEALKIPVDAVILDLYWFGKTITGTMGNLEVDIDSFPDFNGMINRLKAKGVKTITITEPFILTTSNRWEEAIEENILATDKLGHPYTYDFYFGNTGLIDIYNPDGASWFWSIYKELHNKGIAGIWGDLGEPEVHPSELQHYNGSADMVHNIYGHDWAGLVHKGYQKDFPTERPFILMRAGYSGSQRYGMIPWSGDVNRTWGGLQSQPEIALQMGLQGLGYMHSDLGGFAGENLDDELYVRWLQYGVFQPIFRPHAQEQVPSEPVFRSKNAMELSKKAIELRYALLPYNYHLVFENNTKGLPLMRPLFFEDDDIGLKTVSSTYLWGHDFLVAPITNAGQEFKEVHFPKSSNWYDFYTDEKYSGGQSKMIKTKKTSIPTFVRGGSIIPIATPVHSTDFYDLKTFQLHYYLDPSATKTQKSIYNDDGLLANAYEKGNYEILKIDGVYEHNKKIQMSFKSENGEDYATNLKTIELIIHNVSTAPKRIRLNKKNINFQFDESLNSIRTNIVWHTSKTKKLNIKF